MDISRAFMHELDHICLTGERVKFYWKLRKCCMKTALCMKLAKWSYMLNSSRHPVEPFKQ